MGDFVRLVRIGHTHTGRPSREVSLAHVGQQDLSQLTIVIPTVSRPKFVLRQFEYWRLTNAEVVILDGALSPIEVPTPLLSPNIRYVHTGTRFNERLATASQFVHTKYCALLCDDEFFTVSGLRKAIERLESDESIIGCVGRSLYFFVDQGRFLLKDAYREWRPFSRAATSLQVRLDEDLPPNKTHKAQFAVMRSDAWKSMYESAYATYFSSGYTYERILNLQRTILGKTDVLECLLWFRSMENPPISNESVPRVAGRDFLSWARNPEFASEVSVYRDIARDLLLAAGLSSSDAIRLEERFFVDGVQQTVIRKSKLSKRLRDKFRQHLLTWSPKRLRLFVKRHLPNQLLAITGWQGYEIDQMCLSLAERGTYFERGEIEHIENLSLKTAGHAEDEVG